MELLKKNMHMNHLVADKCIQTTVDDDFNVPDAKADMDYMIVTQGDVKIDSTRISNGRVVISGKLVYSLIYGNHDMGGKIFPLNGEIQFEESVNVDDISEGDMVHLETDIEDIDFGIINSRKYSVKAIVGFHLMVENVEDLEMTIDVVSDKKYQKQKETIEAAGLKMNKKDVFRMKEETKLPQNKPNIGNLLWNQVTLSGMESRPLDDKIGIAGVIHVFLMYQPQEENAPIQWMENTIPFKGKIDAEGSREDMISDIKSELGQSDITIKTDEDGELRIISMDLTMDLNIRIYEEQEVSLLQDVYSTDSHVKPEKEKEDILMLDIKNTSQCKVEETVSVEEDKGNVLQICNVSGQIKVDEIEAVENGLSVEGVLQVKMVFITDSDTIPLRSENKELPFTYVIDTPPITKSSHYSVKHCIENLQAVMAGGNEIEIKGVISFDVLVLKNKSVEMIKGISDAPLDTDELEKMPGIVGYMVREGDSLWKIAKENYTTVDRIKEINGLTSEAVEPGDRIIMVKQAREL